MDKFYLRRICAEMNWIRREDSFVKTAVLLIGHGSRDEQGNAEFLRFVEELRERMAGQMMVGCFLEFAKPDIAAGIATCVALGATRIVAVPMILLAASHVKLEIPEFLDEARKLYPSLDIVYGCNIGLHERLLDLLVERFQEADTALASQKTAMEDTAIVLMGRGSSDPDANGDVYKIARMLWERTGVSTVETCFTGITYPSLQDGVSRAVRLGAKRIFVIPYFLFTGILIKRMKNRMPELQQEYPQVSLQMAKYFGLHDILYEVVLDRIQEAQQAKSRMNCDFCQHRQLAQHRHFDHDDLAYRAQHQTVGEVLA